jgi:hypothetical protein
MSFIDKNIEQIKKGFEGEELIRKIFIEKKIKFMQVDIMFKRHNKWCLGEIKTQEKFKSPPFDGHGLPQWQIDRRIEFYKDTGIIPYLIVLDKIDNCIYIQSLLKLMGLKKDIYKTKGNSPRTIFKIDNFDKMPLNNK